MSKRGVLRVAEGAALSLRLVKVRVRVRVRVRARTWVRVS